MLCDICNKNSATVHLTEIVDDQMNELHLCEACARQKSTQMEQQFGLSDLLAGMAEFAKPQVDKEAENLLCSSCKLTYADFKKIGRLGCGDCYSAFRKYLAPLLKRIHGSSQHLGKSPIKQAKAFEKETDAEYLGMPILRHLEDLRSKLQKAIEDEAFEEAVKIRDQIRELEKKQNQGTKGNKIGIE